MRPRIAGLWLVVILQQPARRVTALVYSLYLYLPQSGASLSIARGVGYVTCGARAQVLPDQRSKARWRAPSCSSGAAAATLAAAAASRPIEGA